MTWARWAVITLLLATVARADLFSPGDLAKGHANLEGLSNCTKCHPAGGQLSQESCLACHTELKPRVEKGLGFHGRISSEKRACESCHADHRGRTFAMIDWGTGGQKGFDHDRSGWRLEGKHSKAACDSCHQPRRIFAAAILKLIEKRPETMLGLGKECRQCHFDDHRGQVGDDCDACHDPKGWQPAPGFNHAETDYPLKGKHQKVKCSGCHPTLEDESTPKATFPAPVSETFMKFSPLESKACTDCHKDVHDGRFGQRCTSCHTVDGWKIIRNASAEREFHEKTRFPLKGEHLETPCVSCHGPFPGQRARFKGLAFGQCSACHPDAHLGQLTPAAGKPPDCETCHTVERFMPPRFTVDQHKKTRYPLEGAHAVVACNACHARTPELANRIPRATRLDLKKKKRPELFSFASFDTAAPLEKCESCHRDVHDGQFTGKPCSACHQISSFKQVALDHDRDTRFALTGKHAELACSGCHGSPGPNQPVRYRPLALGCAGCHDDVHAGQLAKVPGAVTACETCHQTSSWNKTLFLHQPPFTDYLLDGKHAQVKCTACHRPVTLAEKVTAVRYKPLPRECESCHSDFHGGSFRGFEP